MALSRKPWRRDVNVLRRIVVPRRRGHAFARAADIGETLLSLPDYFLDIEP
jgi:hypothetical protein